MVDLYDKFPSCAAEKVERTRQSKRLFGNCSGRDLEWLKSCTLRGVMKPEIHTKRVYDERSSKDGVRILVDRLWPRGLKKEDVGAEWAKDLAPSTELRQWFNHAAPLWPDFEKSYKAELRKNEAVDDFLQKHRHDKLITLLYGAKDTEHNHALVLKDYLEERFKKG